MPSLSAMPHHTVDIPAQQTTTNLPPATSHCDNNPIQNVSPQGSLASSSYLSQGVKLPETIYPASPSLTRRYYLKRPVQDISPICILDPLTTSFIDECPCGWQCYIHPEGLRYFCLQIELGGHPTRILTEEWLFNRTTADLIRDFLQEIQSTIRNYELLILPESDLVLELYPVDDSKFHCGYYLAHHPTRSIYWLEQTDLAFQSDTLCEIDGQVSGYQAKTCREYEYWSYWDSFPDVQTLTPEVYDYIVGIITSAMTDVVSSSSSTIAYTYEKLESMMKIIQVAKDHKTSNWHIGRFLKNLVQDRFRNYYGAWGARLSRGQSVLQVTHPEPPSVLLTILSPFLFFLPHVKMTRVEPLVVDRTVIIIVWHQFFGELLDELAQTMMLATIMLAANCAFLAIPIFDPQNSGSAAHSSPAQVASYLSLSTSISGFILSVILYRRYKVNMPETAQDILDLIFKRTKSGSQRRLGHLVILWSLPHAFVLWSVVPFLVAFLLMCLLGTLTITKVIVSLVTFFQGALIFYYYVIFGGGGTICQLWLSGTCQGIRLLRRLFNKGGIKEGEQGQSEQGRNA